MGNFQKVALGLGDLTVDGRDIGYLKDEVAWGYEYEIEKFYAGQPQKLQGQVTTGLNTFLTAKFAEISAENLAMVLGGLTITNQTGSPVTVSMGAVKQFATHAGMGLEYIELGPGPGLATTFASLVVKNAAESTTYTAGTDYLLDPVMGRVYRNPAGSITSLQVVHVGHTYVPIEGKRIDLGTQFSLEQVPCLFTHYRRGPGTERVMSNFWKASMDGKVNLKFAEKTFVLNDFRIDGIDDSNGHPSSPFGYLFEENPAA